MSMHHLFSVSGLFLLIALTPSPLPAQTSQAEPESAKPASPPGDRDARRVLKVARELLDQKRYESAFAILQLLLRPDYRDRLVTVGEGDNARISGVKAEVLRMLANVPAAGQRAYEKLNGQKARDLLATRKDGQDTLVLRAVAMQYPFTEAGLEAEYTLSTRRLRKKAPLLAVRRLNRLRKHPYARDRWEPLLSLQVAHGFARGGMPSRAIAVLEDLRRRSKTGSIILGGAKSAFYTNRANALRWLAGVLSYVPEYREVEKEAWVRRRVKTSPSDADARGIILGPPNWKRSSIVFADSSRRVVNRNAKAARQLLDKLETRWKSRRWITLPVDQPHVVDGRVIHRAGGRLQAVDAKSGKLQWRTFLRDALYSALIEDERPLNSIDAKLRNTTPLLEAYLQQRAWLDTAATRISVGSEFCQMLFTDIVRVPGDAVLPRAANTDPAPYNWLWNCGLRNGKLKWTVGGKPERGKPFSNRFFLSPPTVVGDRLLCLTETGGHVMLTAVELHVEEVKGLEPGRSVKIVSPELDWSIPLLVADLKIGENPIRRLAGDRPVPAGDLLICPITSEKVIAFDPSTQRMVWAYRYRSRIEDYRKRVLERHGVELQQRELNKLRKFDRESRWVDNTPVFAQGRVLLTPRDSDELHCLDVASGKLLWNAKRGEGLFIATVADGNVVVVSKSEIRAHRLADGKPAWSAPVFIPMPAGRGIRAGRFYRLPLSTGEVLSIDLATGLPVARIRVPDDLRLGNLAGGDIVVSQSTEYILGFPSTKETLAKAERALTNNPNDPAALTIRAEYRLQRGNVDNAISDLRKAVKSGANQRNRFALAAALRAKLRRDFKRSQNLIPEIERSLPDDRARVDFYRLLTLDYTRHRDISNALQSLLKMAAALPESPGDLPLAGSGRARADRWIQGRMTDLLAKATPQQKAAFNRSVQKQAAAVIKSRDPAKLRRFLQVFRRHPAANAVRRALVELQ